MSEIIINIAKDFSDAPGARNYKDGPASGEEFYDSLLKNKFMEADSAGENLTVVMDGTFGFATSFISEAFGRLSIEFGSEKVLKIIRIISDEDPDIKDYTLKIIGDPVFKGD